MSRLGEIRESDEFLIEWCIKDFLSLPAEVEDFYESPVFSFAKESWCLLAYPNGTNRNSEGFIDLYLFRESSGQPITMKFTLGVKSVDEKLDPEKQITCVFDDSSHGFARLIRRSKLSERKSDFLPSDTLTFVCRMKRPKLTECESSTNVIETKCSYCNEAFGSQEDIQSHLPKCDELPIKCQKCGEDVALKNWYYHKCQMTTTEGACKTVATKCTYCSKTLKADEDIQCHLRECEDLPLKCRKCGDDIALKLWYDHKCVKSNTKDETPALNPHQSRLKDTSLLSNEKSCVEEVITCPKCLKIFSTKEANKHECLIARAEAIEKLLLDLKQMMLSGDHSDATFKVKTEEFRLHQCILKARNPYLYSILQREINEQATTPTDYELEDFRSFVSYIYTGTADKLSSENAYRLYEITHTYREKHLKEECLHVMMNTISVDNFCDYIALSIRNDENKLFKKASEFFVSKAKEIMSSAQWKIFVEKHPIQASELLSETLAQVY